MTKQHRNNILADISEQASRDIWKISYPAVMSPPASAPAAVEKAPNPSGIVPTEYKVLIEPEAIAEKVGSILMPIEATDKQKYAQTRGRIVAVSPLAFTYATVAEWADAGAVKPKVGDVVLYAKYAGLVVKGPKDGKEYTLANDKDVCATIEE